MQYTQLKQVVEIDSKITHLHKELSHLYATRAWFVGSSGLSGLTVTTTVHQAKATTAMNDPWVTQAYAYLTSAWMVHGIAIPPLSALEKKLQKAHKVLDHIISAEPGLAADMNVVLVPPTNLVTFPTSSTQRQAQPHIYLHDYVNPDLLVSGLKTKKTWQLLIAHCAVTGLNLGSAADIIKNKKYMTASYDSRALGLRQYMALSLQINQVIDQDVWTLLLGERPSQTGLVPCVTFINGQYRFELDETNSILGEERFRPAVEITG